MGLMKGGFEELNARLEAATTGLGGVARKRVFARNTFFVDGKLFALVWREGRIGVKLPEPDGYAELQAHAGALPWIAWGRPMVGWLLVPTEMHSDEAALSKWVRRACEAVRLAAPAPALEPLVGAVEPLPAVASAPAARAPSVRPPKAPSAAPPPRAPSARPPAASPAAAAEPAEANEFSFGDDALDAEDAAIAAASVAPAAPPPPPPAPPPSEPESDGEFSFDAPEAAAEAPAVIADGNEAQESSEFDFGGEPEAGPAAAAPQESGKKKKKKKKTG